MAEAWKVLDVTSGWIAHADAKAGTLLASCGVAGGVLFTLVKSGGYTYTGWVDSSAVVCAVLLALSAASCGLALWPRRDREGRPLSLIYFDHVARSEHTRVEYVEALAELLREPNSLTIQISEQIWIVSRVASAKYAWVDRSLATFLAALLALGIAVSGAVTG